MKKVLLFGSFDPLHDGHRDLLRQAKTLGDYLVVVVARDATITRDKHYTPSQGEQTRLAAIQNVAEVDEAILGSPEPHNYELLSTLDFAVLALGYDQKPGDDIVRAELDKRNKQQVILQRLLPFEPEKHKGSLLRYDYQLPPELIAQQPATPRDSARLLIYDRQKDSVRFDTFHNLNNYLPPKSLLVFNQTKVLPARLTLQKKNGGKVEILYIGHTDGLVEVLANRKLTPGDELSSLFTVESQHENHFFLRPLFPIEELFAVLKKHGSTPLPPYIKHSPLTEEQKREQYQTVFAQQEGSVAAPTASLHFTPELLASLEEAGHTIAYVTLHVNLGTFAPLTPQQLETGKLHEEQYEIPEPTAELLKKAKQEKKPIVAIGTTVVRTLESYAKTGEASGVTDLFIRPGYELQLVDHLITNFHVPQSSLLLLVATLTGREKLLELYQQAIVEKLRFFSFGDGMLVL